MGNGFWVGVSFGLGVAAAVAFGAVLGGADGTAKANEPAPSALAERSVTVKPEPGEGGAEVRQLEERIATLEQRLQAVDEAELWVQAHELGVTRVLALSKTGLSPRQEQRLAAVIVREAQKNKLDPLLVTALIRVESSFNNFAVSNVGAMGLMQIMPDTGEWLAKKREEPLKSTAYLFDFERNVELGCAYFADLLRQFGSVDKALLAYNVGPASAKKLLAGDKVSLKKALSGYAAKVMGEHRRLVALVADSREKAKTAARALMPSRSF